MKHRSPTISQKAKPTITDVVQWAPELARLHARITPHFVRPEPRRRALAYIQGILSETSRKNGWQLAEHAAAFVEKKVGCELYIINTSPTEPESVWVTEVWRSQEEYDASLTVEGVQAAIKQVLPLLADSPEKIDLLPVGGKDLALA